MMTHAFETLISMIDMISMISMIEEACSLVYGFHGNRKCIHTHALHVFRGCIGAWYIPWPLSLGNIP